MNKEQIERLCKVIESMADNQKKIAEALKIICQNQEKMLKLLEMKGGETNAKVG